MTKKDYIVIATALYEQRKLIAGDENTEMRRHFNSLVDRVAEVCARDNPRFDSHRFREAVYRGVIRERAGTREKSINAEAQS